MYAGQPVLYGHLEAYSETWSTSGTAHDGSAYPVPQWAYRSPGYASSSSSSSWPTPAFRTPLASESAGGGARLNQVKARCGTMALSRQVMHLASPL